MQCGRVNDAQRIFDSSTTKTMASYGSMMKGNIHLLLIRFYFQFFSLYLGYLVNKMSEKAIELFPKINNPDEIILGLLFANCSQAGTREAFDFGRQVWSETSLVNHRNKYIVNAALNMFATYGDVLNAENLFITMKPNVIDCGQMMKCYNNQKMPMKTIKLYEKMKNDGLQGSLITFILLADACAQIGIKSYCQSIVSQIPDGLLADVQLRTSLIHMWASGVGFFFKFHFDIESG